MKFAPPEVLSVFATAASNDPDLPDGRHLRFVPAPELGPPLGPIAVWRATASAVRPGAVKVSGGVQPMVVTPPSDGSRVIAAAVANGSLAVLDSSSRLVLKRSPAPAIVAAPRLDRLLASMPNAAVQLFGVSADAVGGTVGRGTPDQVQLIAMPFAAPTPWYAGAITPVAAMVRVRAGAPKRQTVLDQPVGVLKPLAPNDEALRVAGAGDASVARIGLTLAALLASGDAVPPAKRSTTLEQSAGPDGPPSSAELPLWGTLAMQAVDYGVARYLGLGTVLPPVPAPPSGIDAVVALALFALPADALFETDTDADGKTITRQWVDWPPDPSEAGLIDALVKLVPGLDAVIAHAKQAGLAVRAALTAAAVAPPPDAPDVGAVVAASAHWIAANTGPSVAWRQRFGFDTLPGIVTGLAMANTAAGSLQSRNGLDGGTGRRRPMLVGRDPGDNTLAFDRVDATGPTTYQFAACEMFGRYGPPRTLSVTPPPRPPPPRPVPQIAVVRNETVPPDGPTSPGSAWVTVPVPAIENLPAGARPIKGGLVLLNGAPQVSSLVGDTLSATITLPNLLPMTTGGWGVSVVFTDADGTSSPTADSQVTVADGRAPPVLASGPGLIWTSRPANAAVVEASLRWSAMPGALFHVYEASAASLLATIDAGSKPDPSALSRAAFALAILQAAPSTGFPRIAFARLTSLPLKADAGSVVRYAATLPRAQRNVAFLRVVSVSPNGVESDFAKAGLVPLAVPDDLPPPPPRVSLAPSPPAADGTAVQLSIEATGFDLARLAALPGTVPEFRLRGASLSVTDPLYALVLTPGAPLGLSAGKAPAAQFNSTGLKPFVRYTWWAEVRMPAEPALPLGVAAAKPGELQAEFLWQQAPMPATWSRLSAPFSTVPIPPLPPAKLLPTQVGLSTLPGAGTFTLYVAVTGLPVAANGAVGPYLLRIWVATGASSLERVGDVPITASAVKWQGNFPASRTVRCWLALVDPIGREGETFKADPLP